MAALFSVFQDLVTMVEQLARFLGVSCDKAQLESLGEHCHQLVDQCCNAEALPVGRGACPRVPVRVLLPISALGLWTTNSAPLTCALCSARARWSLPAMPPGGAMPAGACCCVGGRPER